MPTSIKLEWSNIQEHKQEAYVGAILEIIQQLGKDGEKARIRMIRQGCDSSRTKEIQFKEPTNIEQFQHIGEIKQILMDRPACITNLPYPPIKTHFETAIAGNSIDRDYQPYGINILITNLTISHRSEIGITNLVNEEFQALNGARLGKWIGRQQIMDEKGQIIKKGAWQTLIHGKMAEYILATGRTSVSKDRPLENQILFEEYERTEPVYCMQCRKWTTHKAIESGIANCSAPGICRFCGQGTSRYLYKQHEENCEQKILGCTCMLCKKEGKDTDIHLRILHSVSTLEDS